MASKAKSKQVELTLKDKVYIAENMNITTIDGIVDHISKDINLIQEYINKLQANVTPSGAAVITSASRDDDHNKKHNVFMNEGVDIPVKNKRVSKYRTR